MTDFSTAFSAAAAISGVTLVDFGFAFGFGATFFAVGFGSGLGSGLGVTSTFFTAGLGAGFGSGLGSGLGATSTFFTTGLGAGTAFFCGAAAARRSLLLLAVDILYPLLFIFYPTPSNPLEPVKTGKASLWMFVNPAMMLNGVVFVSAITYRSVHLSSSTSLTSPACSSKK